MTPNRFNEHEYSTMLSLISVALALALAAPPQAQPQSQSHDGASETAPAKDQHVCRRVQVTGSRRPSRVCHTAQEWQEIDRQNSVAPGDRGRANGT